ncbi:BREX-2 system phosphatase PglZ [Lentzea sp. NPDC042327]|uniref:BREX-2 system phosphatase PglZ n=1 Tax=Lentzea sp. NPDC042327 TaxID=3154801 RepID=UPI0033CCFE26
MVSADLGPAVENAVTSRVAKVIAALADDTGRAPTGRIVVGIHTRGTPVWHGPERDELHGRIVRYVACPSVLSVLDALADGHDDVLVVLTDRDQSELGDAIMARLHNEKLHDVSKYTLLQEILRARQLDPQLRGADNVWLVDALVDLARKGDLTNTAGLSFGREVALGHVVRGRLAVDPALLDLPGLITTLDNPSVRLGWRDLRDAERAGITAHLAERLGNAAAVVVRLAAARDDVIAELLVADVLARAPQDDVSAVKAFGAFTHSRFGLEEPDRADLAGAAAHAVELALTNDMWDQIKYADTLLAQLNASPLAYLSRALHSGFTARLERAATSLDEQDLAAVEEHHDAGEDWTAVRRLRAAVRLRRWLDAPGAIVPALGASLRHHARELSWVDAELNQVRRGSANPVVAKSLHAIAERAGVRRAEFDRQFARALPEAAHTCPDDVVGVERLLPDVIAPLVREHKVLLLIIDGMPGAAAVEITDSIVDNRRREWTEVVRAADGGREAVLAAFPTETTYSRTSLLTASLVSGTQEDERRAFSKHAFWPPRTRAVLVHKAGLGGSHGRDLSAELEAEFALHDGPQVVAVVLNTVDDALAKGRQSDDPSWSQDNVAGLPQLLRRAAENGWIVVLTSDHGHVLEHGSTHHPDGTGGARWRSVTGEVRADEVRLSGQRVLAPGGTAVLATSDRIRYGGRAYGYHGGASLAEVAIPLVVLLPPQLEELAGWAVHSLGAPDWWTGRETAPAAPVTPKASAKPSRRKTQPQSGQPDLFSDAGGASASRGTLLITCDTFVNTHKGQPANRVLKPEVFRDVVDAVLAAGGRLPVADVLAAAKTPGRNPRGLVAALGRVLNIDQFPVVDLIDNGRTVVINGKLLDEQFPAEDR